MKSLASARLTVRNDVLDTPVEGLTVFAPENEAFTTPKELTESYEVYGRRNEERMDEWKQQYTVELRPSSSRVVEIVLLTRPSQTILFG